MSTRDNGNNVVGIGATAMASLQPMTNTAGTTNSLGLLLRHPTNGLSSGNFCWGEMFAMGRWDNCMRRLRPIEIAGSGVAA